MVPVTIKSPKNKKKINETRIWKTIKDMNIYFLKLDKNFKRLISNTTSVEIQNTINKVLKLYDISYHTKNNKIKIENLESSIKSLDDVTLLINYLHDIEQINDIQFKNLNQFFVNICQQIQSFKESLQRKLDKSNEYQENKEENEIVEDPNSIIPIISLDIPY